MKLSEAAAAAAAEVGVAVHIPAFKCGSGCCCLAAAVLLYGGD